MVLMAPALMYACVGGLNVDASILQRTLTNTHRTQLGLSAIQYTTMLVCLDVTTSGSQQAQSCTEA